MFHYFLVSLSCFQKSNLKQKNAKICLEVGEMWVLWVCGCGTVGRAVASNARGTEFENQPSASFKKEHLFTLKC